MSGAHRPTLLAALLALVTAIAGVTEAFSGGPTHPVTRGTAAKAIVAAQSASNPACNPAPGAGQLGSCAPHQALGAANALGKAAGDPDVITGQPLGVDTSSYQPCGYDMGRFDFVFFKATESTGYLDRCLAPNVAKAKSQGKPYGAYDFLRPSYSHSAEQEADHFIAAVRGAGASESPLPPVADVEANAGLNGYALHSYVCRWVNRVRSALNPRAVIVYTGNWFWAPQVGRQDNCGTLLWISAYAPYAIVPASWSHKVIWQYSDGIYGPTPHLNGWDSDAWYGTGSESIPALIAPAVPAIVTTRCTWLEFYLGRQRALRAKGKKLGHWGRHEIRHHRNFVRAYNFACHAGHITGPA